mmetsp:Transcript_29313/g.41500  ORF Transcript_29313/g.41500 Transcript_29313/m.41500 type:complete len:112 (+) Transcript_29313:230-565(+)|eukprot:CAMPEP_0202442904 /NCGR_PEP_ID=MMETSP1360-20130828/2264_1 /ASSEMBLY_ACC=CAM_ASM_000848 /TAXON_ID=515479 /ORGANISM="Licmophora paradoxa, Strain CCMP2313" /LENGTH=111 /DNA_ID=CAMNT_0049058413 /DNA_START=308 /DNA_END=643 /DNA_ORIENTATION=+
MSEENTSIIPFASEQNETEKRTVPYVGRPSAAVEEIMGKFVSDGEGRIRYNKENITFMMWLFDQDPEEFLYEAVLWMQFEPMSVGNHYVRRSVMNTVVVSIMTIKGHPTEK